MHALRVLFNRCTQRQQAMDLAIGAEAWIPTLCHNLPQTRDALPPQLLVHEMVFIGSGRVWGPCGHSKSMLPRNRAILYVRTQAMGRSTLRVLFKRYPRSSTQLEISRGVARSVVHFIALHDDKNATVDSMVLASAQFDAGFFWCVPPHLMYAGCYNLDRTTAATQRQTCCPTRVSCPHHAQQFQAQ